MGLSLFSSCSEEEKESSMLESIGRGLRAQLREIRGRNDPKKAVAARGNPDPKNCTIEELYPNCNFTAMIIRYHDCTNYEGKKILVYNISAEEIRNYTGRGYGLDPHFCEHVECLSPIARFEPTTRGWKWAKELVDRLNEGG